MSEDYPIDVNQLDDAKLAFDYLVGKDREDLIGILDGAGYFEPEEVLYSGVVSHYAFLVQHEPDVDGSVTRRLFMADIKDGAAIGISQILARVNSHEELVLRPYVVYTETEVSERKQGHGRSRLEVLNEYSKKIFGAPLTSDVNLEPEAESIWLGLVRDGRAVYNNGRYTFLEDVQVSGSVEGIVTSTSLVGFRESRGRR